MEELKQIIENSNIWLAMATPLILIVLDICTGLAVSWKDNNYQSSRMRQGLAKKFGEIIYIIIGILAKFIFGLDIVLYFAVGYILLMELTSLAENVDKLGIPLPKKLSNKLNNINDEINKEDLNEK